jgi:hypothetical protein
MKKKEAIKKFTDEFRCPLCDRMRPRVLEIECKDLSECLICVECLVKDICINVEMLFQSIIPKKKTKKRKH